MTLFFDSYYQLICLEVDFFCEDSNEDNRSKLEMELNNLIETVFDNFYGETKFQLGQV